MVSLNVANIPTPLWNALLELKGKLHARTWVEVLQYAVQEPDGTIDYEIFQGGIHKCPSCGKPALGQPANNLALVFRTGDFIYDFDGRKPKTGQFRALQYPTRSDYLGPNKAPNHQKAANHEKRRG